MTRPLATLARHIRRTEMGATTIEYALMLVLVAIAVAVASPNVRGVIVSVFSLVGSVLDVGG